MRQATSIDGLLASIDIAARVRRDWERMARDCDYRIQVVSEYEALAIAPLSCQHASSRIRGCFDETDFELSPWIQTPDGMIAWFSLDEGMTV